MKLGTTKEQRMDALTALYKSDPQGHCRSGMSSSGPFYQLVDSIVEDERVEGITPRMGVMLRLVRLKLADWLKIEYFIDRSTPAWEKFKPPA